MEAAITAEAADMENIDSLLFLHDPEDHAMALYTFVVVSFWDFMARQFCQLGRLGPGT